MNLKEIDREKALEIYETDTGNKLWVMRVFPKGPVDLVPLSWIDMESEIFKDDFFFKNKLTRYFLSNTDVVKEMAEPIKELNEHVQNYPGKNLEISEKSFENRIKQMMLPIEF